MPDKFIPINITKAKVVAVYLQFKEEMLEFSAEVSLISDVGKQITTIRIGNGNWDKEQNADLSLETIELANELRAEVETSITRYMNAKQKLLGKG